MKESYKIKKVNSILSIFGLVLLLLLSPCKVRNFIQAELGLSKTEVLNKSQLPITQSNCQTFEVSQTVQTISEITFQPSNFLIPEASRFHITKYLLKHSFNLNTSKSQRATDVPFYILYQNLKIYS
ncbi:hypothetical protein [Polaribacter vadi]|jgi:hypothetical protein|uniref:hypothetical protein n=1 Tax=Polaribacter vadi TaxID=1774273 RepID=UPI0030EB45CE|tara:strand:- start:19415 stop:19792 length:378 start_codon:yes stop_codon:yes gene_type:complete